MVAGDAAQERRIQRSSPRHLPGPQPNQPRRAGRAEGHRIELERYMGGPSIRDGPALRGPHKNPKSGLDEF